jgi:hypothetical protein
MFNGSSTGKFIFTDFCYPAKVYLIIAMISLLYYVSTGQDMIWVIAKALLFTSYSFALNKLCSLDLKAIAWLLAIIPQCIFLFFTIKTSPAIPRKPNSGSDDGSYREAY